MSDRERWLLPDGVDEVLPPRARALEDLRRTLLDIFERWGYSLVIPPIVEYLDSLLSGIGEDLDLQTFKLIDQVSGRLMGIPADITPQIARIDAYAQAAEGPRRFCYVGPVVHTLPDKFAGSRNPLQIGAELYNHSGIEGDAEVISLLLEVLTAAGIKGVTLELGHMGLFHAICENAEFDEGFETRVLEMLLMKNATGLEEFLADSHVFFEVKQHLLALLELNGSEKVLANARATLKGAPSLVDQALDDIECLVSLIRDRIDVADVHIDLAELRGYRYHTGIMFAAYTPSMGRAIAWGGRYNNISKLSDFPRSATGFSTDLKVIASLSPEKVATQVRVLAPSGNDPELVQAVNDYRNAGYTVIQELPGQCGGAVELGCEKQLAKADGNWQLKNLKK